MDIVGRGGEEVEEEEEACRMNLLPVLSAEGPKSAMSKRPVGIRMREIPV